MSDAQNGPQTEREQYIKQLERNAAGTFWDYLGCKLEKLNEHEVAISLQVQKHHLNGYGILNGGVHASLLDNGMGIAAMAARPREKVVTTNLNVHYVTALGEGRIKVTAEIVHQSGKMITVIGRLTDENGRIGAFGSGSFRVI